MLAKYLVIAIAGARLAVGIYFGLRVHVVGKDPDRLNGGFLICPTAYESSTNNRDFAPAQLPQLFIERNARSRRTVHFSHQFFIQNEQLGYRRNETLEGDQDKFLHFRDWESVLKEHEAMFKAHEEAFDEHEVPSGMPDESNVMHPYNRFFSGTYMEPNGFRNPEMRLAKGVTYNMAQNGRPGFLSVGEVPRGDGHTNHYTWQYCRGRVYYRANINRRLVDLKPVFWGSSKSSWDRGLTDKQLTNAQWAREHCTDFQLRVIG